MLSPSKSFARRFATATVFVLGAALVPPVFAADTGNDSATPTALSVLINRLAEKGVLSKADKEELMLLAEADAAESRAQSAAVAAAEARAQAAEARARAMAAMLAHHSTPGAGPSPSDQVRASDQARADDVARDTAIALAAAEAAQQQQQLPAPRPVAPVPRKTTPPPAPEPAESTDETAPVPPAPTHVVAKAAPAPATSEETASTDAPAAPGEGSADEAKPADDTVRVTYVPEVVQQHLREQVKQDVLDDARKEGWATPSAVPEWVSRFRFFGDFRMRYEGIRYPAGNGVGEFINFNAINSGAPIDLAGIVPAPKLNVDQDRNRLRIRARLGTSIDLGENFSAGIRLATGESNSPVSENQTLGAVGTGQGGDFSKQALWLDRAFLRYEIGGLPDEDLMVDFGRFDNPFMSATMLWADDLAFDGIAAHGREGFGEDVTSFFVLGAFPVFNTDLNFATTQSAKYKSNDKWLYAAQLGATFDLGENVSLKLAAAYYLFQNVQGQLSTPFTPLSAADAGDTDATRPLFAQTGNTYMALRDIIPGPLNGNGTTNQWQYFGLASEFHPLVFDARLEFNHFQPVQIALTAEYVKNLAFNQEAIAAVAVNNRGPDDTTTGALGPYLGGDTAWLVALTVGDVAMQKRGDWTVTLGYRKVGSDALIDGFCDSDFGGGGTNFKGVTFMGNLALSSKVWLGLRWMSANTVAGPVLKNDIIQFDINGKF
jgi:Putative porin